MVTLFPVAVISNGVPSLSFVLVVGAPWSGWDQQVDVIWVADLAQYGPAGLVCDPTYAYLFSTTAGGLGLGRCLQDG